MKQELRQRQLLFYSMAYMTNINYLIVLLILSFHLEFDKDPFFSIIIWGVPAFLSTLISMVIIRQNLLYEKPREEGIIKLALAHIPSLLGLIGALIYMFY